MLQLRIALLLLPLALGLQKGGFSDVPSCVETCRDRGVGCRGWFRVTGGDEGTGFGALFFSFTVQQIHFAEQLCMKPYIDYAENQSAKYWEGPHPNPWDHFFEPVPKGAEDFGQTCWMTYEGARSINGYCMDSGYFRKTAVLKDVISRYHRPQQKVLAALDKEWARLFPDGTGPVLGMHIRGTDRALFGGFTWRKDYDASGPKLYLTYANEFLEKHPDGVIFLATDDKNFHEEVMGWPASVSSRVKARSVTRGGREEQIFGTEGHKVQEGIDVFLDYLILTRCKALLHGTSELAWAVRWWPGAHFDYAINVESEDEEDWKTARFWPRSEPLLDDDLVQKEGDIHCT